MDCHETSLVYKYIKSAYFLGRNKPLLEFHHALKCKWVKESDANPFGFKNSKECLATMIELQEWTGLETLDAEQITEIKGFGFNDALTCRWMRKDPEWNQHDWENQSHICLVTIQQQRALLKAEPFNEAEIIQLTEPRFTEPLTIQTITRGSWNDELFQPNENYNRIKTWLDLGGDVTFQE